VPVQAIGAVLILLGVYFVGKNKKAVD
jgi:hypothetical protein